MSGYVDIHAHVLPGIDDGPRDMEASLAMARAAVESGTTTIASTPHLRSDFPNVHVHELAERCAELRDALEREGIPLRLVSAAEVSLSWALDASEDELRLASYGQRGTDLLIETPSSNVLGLDRVLYEFRAKGYRVILAHPERTPEFHRQESLLRSLVDHSILLQVNAESLLGQPRRSGLRQFARYLCVEGLAHVIASDGHRGARWRPVTELSESVPAARDLVGVGRVDWMISSAPGAIIDGRELPEAPEVVPPPRLRTLFGRR